MLIYIFTAWMLDMFAITLEVIILLGHIEVAYL